MISKGKTLDWQKVKEYIESGDYDKVDAGLLGDWYMTVGKVWPGLGEPYVSSNWAIPAVEVWKNGWRKTIECFVEKGQEKMSREDFEVWLKIFTKEE